jgi:pimeloyl-ACP methyl ester carboxylesterase
VDNRVVDNRVEWLCGLSGGALRFAPFPTCKLAGVEPSCWGSRLCLPPHINDVVNMILFEDLHDVILVGHSYGGMVITGVADRVPDRIRRLIYLDAFVPNDGESVLSLLGPRATWLKQMTQGDYIVPPWVTPEQPLPKDVPQPLKTVTEPIVLKNKAARQIPATYILTVEAGHDAKADDFASQAERAKERGWTIYQLQADHNAQRSAPEALVEMLDRK